MTEQTVVVGIDGATSTDAKAITPVLTKRTTGATVELDRIRAALERIYTKPTGHLEVLPAEPILDRLRRADRRPLTVNHTPPRFYEILRQQIAAGLLTTSEVRAAQQIPGVPDRKNDHLIAVLTTPTLDEPRRWWLNDFESWARHHLDTEGRPFELDPWQRCFLDAFYGPPRPSAVKCRRAQRAALRSRRNQANRRPRRHGRPR